MTTQDKFIAQTQRLIENWQAQIEEYNEGLKTSGAQARADFDEITGQLEGAISQALVLVEQTQAVNKVAWSDMESTTQNALDQIQKVWQKASSHSQ